SRSLKLQPYMTPWSCGSMACVPPAAVAVFTSSSTSARLLHESAKRPSAYVLVSHGAFRVNVRKKGSERSITYASSPTTMQAALSSVTCGLNEKPSVPKKSIDRFRSRTARLTNIFRERVAAMGLLLNRELPERAPHPGDPARVAARHGSTARS